MNNDTSQSKRGQDETDGGDDSASQAVEEHTSLQAGDQRANTSEADQSDGARSSEAGAGAKPDQMGSWLTTGLRPSPSKSLPPQALEEASTSSPETLAPQVMPPEHHDDEDLVVIPGLSRSGSRWGKLAAIALVAGLLLMAGASWWRGSEPAATAEPAAAPEPSQQLVDMPQQTPPASPTDGMDPEELSERLPPAAAPGWFAADPMAPIQDESAPYRPGGPSVGRLPDLPPEYWSKEREREKQLGSVRDDAAEDEQPLGE